MHPLPSGSGPPNQFDLDNLDPDNFDFTNFDALEAAIHRPDPQADVVPSDVEVSQVVEASENVTAPVHDETTIDLDGNMNVTTAEIMELFPEWLTNTDIDVNAAPTPQAPPPQQDDISTETQDDVAKLQALHEQNRILNERAAVRYAEERRQKAEKERAELKERKQKMEAEKKAKQEALRARIARARELEERARKAKELEEEQKRRASAEAFKKLQETRARSQIKPQLRSILKSTQVDKNSPVTKRRRNSQEEFHVRFETGKALKKVKIFDKDKPVSPIPKTMRPQSNTEAMDVGSTAQSAEIPQMTAPAVATEPQQPTAPVMAPDFQSTAPAIATRPPQLTAPTITPQSLQRAHTSVATPTLSNHGNVVDPINRPQLDAVGAAPPGHPNPLLLDYVPSFAHSAQSPASGAIRSASGRGFTYNPQITPDSAPPFVGYSPYVTPSFLTPSFVGNSPYATIRGNATHDLAQRGHSNTAPQPSSGFTRSNDLPQQLRWENITPTDHIAAPPRIRPVRPSASSSTPGNRRLSANVSAASRAAYLPIAQAVRGGFLGALPPIQRIPPPPLQFEIDETMPACEKCRVLHKRCKHRKAVVPRTRQASDEVCEDCRINKRRCTHNGVAPTQTNPPSTDVPAKKKRKTSQMFTRKHQGFRCDKCRRLKQSCKHDDPSLSSEQMSDGDLMQSATDLRAQLGALQETRIGLGGLQDDDVRRRRDLERRISSLEESLHRVLAELTRRGLVMPSMPN